MIMKRNALLAFLMTFMAIGINAQNLQLHYDFGRPVYSDEEANRQNVTATFEKFSADDLGSWYYFVDLDVDKDGVMSAYSEVSREFSFAKASESSAFAAHIEFDGGMGRGGSYQSAALIGGAWNGHNADFSTTYSVQAMYKQFFKQSNGVDAYPSLQLTGVNHHGKIVILTEPQFWWNVSGKVSFGTEVEISDNFIYNTYNDKTFFINPTLAVKFNL